VGQILGREPLEELQIAQGAGIFDGGHPES
jgi:hypothetical protein